MIGGEYDMVKTARLKWREVKLVHIWPSLMVFIIR